MEIGTLHRNDDVEVYLQFVRDAFFDGEEVRLVAVVPAEELGEGEDGRYEDEEERGVASCGGATGVGWFCFCYTAWC